jgi:hypothetical protein
MPTRFLRFLLLLAVAFSGCAPRELFSAIDRHCLVADWANHHSCVSCCCCKNGSCRRPAPRIYPMVELGDAPASGTAMK